MSSHRSLVQRLETVALSDDLCDRGEQVTLFLFSDCLEVSTAQELNSKRFDTTYEYKQFKNFEAEFKSWKADS